MLLHIAAVDWASFAVAVLAIYLFARFANSPYRHEKKKDNPQ